MTPAHRVPPSVRLREALLAALPALLTALLLLLATQPAYETLIRRGSGWTPYAYQGLVQDVQAYQVARLDPRVSKEERQMRYEIALSSAVTPTQFTQLAAVEARGEARLSRVAALLRENTPQSVAEAAREAVRLNAQAGDFAGETRVQYVRALEEMRRALVATAAATGLLSMLLTGRALLLWRAERERRARREARQREALSLASHELRRPLQALLLASDLLRQAETPEQRQHLLALIEDSAAQLASRADLTRLEDLYLDVTLRLTRPDLRTLVGRVAGGRVSVHLPSEPVVWPVDARQVRQIVENLVENALKYTAGPVEVTLDTPGGQPEITVRDHGPGMSAELRERAFLPYERGPRGLTEGRGLGLSLVRRYARAHGGDVTLEDAPGGGTLARVTLGEPPLVDEPPLPRGG
ncbi:sensor histidine kinase KdpD [Deinococcus sp. YIM 77859]|uniref:sensor histidine kinase n=1 Tax=Deinococcus sp. YIM 77859 TaxID=1540221 RepID=UPI000AC482BE|nr:HAMP domain-containing sensor histidine kinase [Deinococcus sp. YIM 77859]